MWGSDIPPVTCTYGINSFCDHHFISIPVGMPDATWYYHIHQPSAPCSKLLNSPNPTLQARSITDSGPNLWLKHGLGLGLSIYGSTEWMHSYDVIEWRLSVVIGRVHVGVHSCVYRRSQGENTELRKSTFTEKQTDYEVSRILRRSMSCHW